MQTSIGNSKNERPGIQSLGLDIRQLLMLGVLVVVWILFQILTNGLFLSSINLWNLAVQTAVVGIMVGGMVLVIVMRHIDLSVGSLLGFTAMTIALLQGPVGLGADWPWFIALLLGFALAVAIGAFNGYWVAYWGIPSFVVTVAGLLIFRNTTFIASSGRTIAPMDDPIRWMGSGSIGFGATWVVGLVIIAFVIYQALTTRRSREKHGLPVRPMWAEWLVNSVLVVLTLSFVVVMNSYPYPGTDVPRGMPVPVLIMLLVLAFLAWMTRATRFGRYIFAIGGNPDAALLAGLNVRRITIYVFMLMGFLTALAAAVQAGRLNAATANLGRDLELSVIAAAVIGGTALAGGSGTIIGAALGALLMASIQNGLVLMGVPTEWQNVVLGSVLLAAVIWNTVYLRNRK
ncbi:MAG: sugar ABC transporter permease [Meiothermus sp.]|nr:sugar ABC transporter permease [Meiothermus sp.]